MIVGFIVGRRRVEARQRRCSIFDENGRKQLSSSCPRRGLSPRTLSNKGEQLTGPGCTGRTRANRHGPRLLDERVHGLQW